MCNRRRWLSPLSLSVLLLSGVGSVGAKGVDKEALKRAYQVAQSTCERGDWDEKMDRVAVLTACLWVEYYPAILKSRSLRPAGGDALQTFNRYSTCFEDVTTQKEKSRFSEKGRAKGKKSSSASCRPVTRESSSKYRDKMKREGR